MPTEAYRAAAHSTPARGRTVSRPGKVVISVRLAWPSTQAGLGARPALSPPASTMAAAPSEDGHDSRKWIGSHSMGDSRTFSTVMSGICRWE